MKMLNPMLIWYMVAAAVILAIVIEFILQQYHKRRIHRQSHPHHLIGTLHERDLFYIPGDIRYNDQDDDFDDC